MGQRVELLSTKLAVSMAKADRQNEKIIELYQLNDAVCAREAGRSDHTRKIETTCANRSQLGAERYKELEERAENRNKNYVEQLGELYKRTDPMIPFPNHNHPNLEERIDTQAGTLQEITTRLDEAFGLIKDEAERIDAVDNQGLLDENQTRLRNLTTDKDTCLELIQDHLEKIDKLERIVAHPDGVTALNDRVTELDRKLVRANTLAEQTYSEQREIDQARGKRIDDMANKIGEHPGMHAMRDVQLNKKVDALAEHINEHRKLFRERTEALALHDAAFREVHDCSEAQELAVNDILSRLKVVEDETGVPRLPPNANGEKWARGPAVSDKPDNSPLWPFIGGVLLTLATTAAIYATGVLP